MGILKEGAEEKDNRHSYKFAIMLTLQNILDTYKTPVYDLDQLYPTRELVENELARLLNEASVNNADADANAAGDPLVFDTLVAEATTTVSNTEGVEADDHRPLKDSINAHHSSNTDVNEAPVRDTACEEDQDYPQEHSKNVRRISNSALAL